ncbi:MAG: SIR2 family protein, partial [Chloroflexia bacterium]
MSGLIADRHIQALRTEVTNNRLVPVVGSGVSKQVAEIPLWWGVIDHALNYIAEAKAATEDEVRNARELLTANQLIPAAECVRSMLGGPDGEFSSWLAYLFGVRRYQVAADRTAAIDSIVNLMCPILATTNYDKLLSELHFDYFADVTWQEPALMQRAIREGGKVLHLHGVYDRPESVVFGQGDYDRIVSDKAYQMVLQTIWLEKTLLFIGCSFDGLKDPDFSRLLTWATEAFRGTPYKHYALARNGTATDDIRTFLNTWRIQVIEYGNKFSDLPGWLDAMNPRLADALAARAEKAKRIVEVGGRVLATAIVPTLPEVPIDFPRYIEFVKQYVQDATSTHPLTMKESQPSFMLEQYHFDLTVQSEDLNNTHYSLSEAVAKVPQLLLVGEAGSGKTQLLRREALAGCAEFEQMTAQPLTGQHALRIPVLVSLAAYDGSLTELIRETFRLAGLEISNAQVDLLAAQGTLYLLLDGLDETQPMHSLALQQDLRKWRNTYAKSRMVVSTRHAYDAQRLGMPSFTISPLKASEVDEFLMTTLGLSKADVLAIREGLPDEFRDIQSSPFTLELLALVYLNAGGALPRSRSELYRESISILLDRSERRGYTSVERGVKVHLLSQVASWMQNNGMYRISMSALGILIRHGLTITDNDYDESRV